MAFGGRLVIVRTNAPVAYDYAFSRHVRDEVIRLGKRRFAVRVVDIPVEHVHHQTDRYRSGSYLVLLD